MQSIIAFKTSLFLRAVICCAIVVLLGLISTFGTSRPQQSETTQKLAELEWMSGHWQTTAGRAQVEEHWTKASGGTMIGMGRTIVEQRTAEFEYLRLEQRGDEIYYVASPKGRCPGTDFKLTRLVSEEAVFENPQHDFPKRITYRKTAEGLVATVDGGEGTKAQTFSYRKL